MQNLKNATKSLILPLESIGIRPQMKTRGLEITEQSVSFVTKSSQPKLTIAIYEPWLWSLLTQTPEYERYSISCNLIWQCKFFFTFIIRVFEHM